MSHRTAIAAALLDSKDWFSGEALAAELGISRAAVSKHIRVLAAAGYRIERAPRKGYRLVQAPDRLLPERILADAGAARLCRGGIIHHEETESTNTDARALAEQGAADGTLVVAECQTAGRGRMGRPWVSPAGDGIYASLILRPDMPLHRVPLLTLLTAVAAAEAIRRVTGLSACIKWPNDLLIGNRKVAGVLTEAASEIDAVEFVIVGLGMNVNTPKHKLPPRPLYPATSIRAESGQPVDRLGLLVATLDRFGYWYRRLGADGADSLRQRWLELSGMQGRRIRIQREAITIRGTVDGIDTDGALLLTDSAGRPQRIYSGDILP